MNIEEYQTLQRNLERARSKVFKAQGSLRTLEESLLDEFDCKNIEEGQELLKKLSNKKEALEKKADSNFRKVQKKWEEIQNG